MKVFDWNKAAMILRHYRKNLGDEFKHVCVDACLAEDYGNTEGAIISNGEIPKDDYKPYLASIWATPMFTVYIDKNDEGEEYECWKYSDQTPGWDAMTFWPEESIEIFNLN